MNWHKVADVVVVGYGGAGATAAIEAFGGGASVIVLEKNPEGGGNTKYSGGRMREIGDPAQAVEFLTAISMNTTPREVVQVFMDEHKKTKAWLEKIGGQWEMAPTPVAYPGSRGVPFRPIPGSEGITGERFRVRGPVAAGAGPGGFNLWALVSRVVESKGIEVLTSANARRLVHDRQHGVMGVLAETNSGEMAIKARKGVVLACGGFENDAPLQYMYLGQKYYALCNPANTGDGIRMAQELGADLWHMNAVAATFGLRVPDFDTPIRLNVHSPGFVIVDQDGKRFTDEAGVDGHLAWSQVSYVDIKTLRNPRVPAYLIFDDDACRSGPIGATYHGRISDSYQWSQDNSQEVRKGWIKVAETVGELAGQLDLRADVLQETVARYNMLCVAGYDPDQGRRADTLVPVARPLFFGVAIWPCLFNTQGGPRRDAGAHVVDVYGRPIPRLYSAGELGSMWSPYYIGAGNVSECLAYGRIAGRNAAAETPWTDE